VNFAVNLSNHNSLGRRSLEDPAAIIMHQLHALGHQVARIDGKALADGAGITIAFEGWIDEQAAEEARTARQKGARLLIIATEEPTPKGFNHGLAEQFVRRQEVFPLVAAEAEAIWCLVPGTAAWYGQWGPPAVDMELGWARTLERQGPEPDTEFCFFGNFTERRRKVIERLIKRVSADMKRHGHFERFNAMVTTYFAEGGDRDTIVWRGKVLPLIRAHEPMGLVSSSRISTTLHLGRPIVAEPHQLSQNWEAIVDFAASTEEFYRRAVDARHGWRWLHARQMKAFREAMSPEQQVGRALRETGLIERPLRSGAA
jgi:hypothetical protein